MAEAEQEKEISIDEQADMVEMEMAQILEEENSRPDLTPWLIPLVILAAFAIVIIIEFW
jgi:hypothetical protein